MMMQFGRKQAFGRMCSEKKVLMPIQNVFGDLPEVTTERLRLRKLRIEDIDAVYAYASDPQVSRYTLWSTHRTSAESKAYIKAVLDQYAAGEVAVWALERSADGVCIGTGGFVSWQPQHRRAEIGYALARAYWGVGYGTEAARAFIEFGFEQMQCHRIHAFCSPENIASWRVMEKAGMLFEGTMRGYVQVDNQPQDLRVYAILRDEG
ncbi:MAG: GNAT family N-acetyltransferase [Anaerolineae bacterium]|nr:GNAT family N-acetyltransferase [Anaerolineae bacterium]